MIQTGENGSYLLCGISFFFPRECPVFLQADNRICSFAQEKNGYPSFGQDMRKHHTKYNHNQ